jgi:DNA mismatch repair protein MutL
VSDVIELLSDHIANQIAAGEVIQRPASAVKELLENSIDAGATNIQLIIKDAGKALIQVIDNGKGMSTTDARMSFERHATSKIRNINDLFSIRTMGFRGEALASIAAVAQVEMKTCLHDAELGTRICVEGTEVILQEPCATPPGTNLMVKNLFYNVPARRHFLKSNTTEFRHIMDEFTRVAMAYPQVTFRLWHNGTEQFHLSAGTLKARIVGLLGNSQEKNLVPVAEQTEYLSITGFIGKPEAAMRTRGMQYFFINNRFFRSSYLHHAVTQGYEGLIEKETFPFYVLFLEVDPARVDVNVHPTKQEVKFEDDRMMYSYLHAVVKHALARYNMAPALDFTLNAEIQKLPAVRLPATAKERDSVAHGYLFHSFAQKNQAHLIDKKDSLNQWKQLYEIAQSTPETVAAASQTIPAQMQISEADSAEQAEGLILSVQGTFLVTTVKSGLMLVHIRRAQERIWYERLLQEWQGGHAVSQQVLFPVSCELAPQDALLLTEVLPDLARIGFDIVPFGQHTFVVQGIPSGLPGGIEKTLLDEIVAQQKNESDNLTGARTERMLAQLARRLSRNTQTTMQPEGQRVLIDELFACRQPEYTPNGKKVFAIIRRENMETMLA